ncbi:site-specific integrase [Priestia taiwanensis]|uniref:Site-specific integrase n=1 Tax=Priestia taiwanensis TaxID=1347902 RepID=A0A917ANV4_9BACI|nr:site-specific integrase [Priestia taiwanensis]MBM7362595.1 integrase [Priestia taiwanensis]GGE63525.1 site-specific integrase [Priestia taiwanensis]
MKGYFRKHGDTWSFTIDIGMDDLTGKRKQKTKTGFKTKKEAQKAAALLITELEQGIYVEEKKITVKDFMLDWLENVARHNVKPSSFVSYKSIVQTRIIPVLGKYHLTGLKPAIVNNFYTYLLKDENLSEEYVGTVHAVLGTAFNTAVKWEYIKSNVFKKVSKPRKKKKEMQTWSFEEARNFLEYAKKGKRHYYMLYLLAIYTGMRRSKILGIRWSDVNFETGKIGVKRTLYYTSEQGIIVQSTKNSQSMRSISISDFVLDELKQHKVWQLERKLQFNIPYYEESYITANETGDPLSPSHVYGHFSKAVKNAGIKKIRFHDLRHTHASLMLLLGEHPKIVSERLGHSSIEMTMNTYSHVTFYMQKESSNRFEEALKKTN